MRSICKESLVLSIFAGPSSAGSIDLNWRLNPEVKREAWHYAHTGGIVDDPLWRSLQARRELAPARFDANHPNIAGYFTPPAVLGMQPHGPVLDELRRRFDLHPDRFERNHEFWGRIFAMEPISVPRVPDVPSVTPPPLTTPGDTPCPPLPPPTAGQGAVPEPDSILILGTAVVLVMAGLWGRRKVN